MGFFLKCVTDAPPFLEYVEQSLLLTCMMTTVIDYLVLLPSYSIMPFGTILSGPHETEVEVLWIYLYTFNKNHLSFKTFMSFFFTYFSSLCSSDNILHCTSFNTPCKAKI